MRQARAILALPFMVTVVGAAIVLASTDEEGTSGLRSVAGALLVVVGLALWAWTVRLFAVLGRGTLAPWDPPTELVVEGPYRYVRNPMITGVVAVLAGEALFFGSWSLAIYAAVFVAVNAVWFRVSEEPGLRRRFGPAYDEYAREVPRWLPRLWPAHKSRRAGS
jgi:protein-S-isoprenylcysteine O-methyltransferase Ste14